MPTIKRIHYSSHFIRATRKLTLELQNKTIEREKIFGANCFDPRLDTHKLSGKLKRSWSFSVDFHNRILFDFLPNNEVLFIDVGDHDIYK